MTEAQPIPFIPLPTARQVMGVRAYFKWNQTEAASQLNVGATTLIDFERGARNPQDATRAKMGLAMIGHGIRFDEAGNIVLPP